VITASGLGIELEEAGTRVLVGTVAAVLRGLEVDGVALTEPLADGAAPRFASGIVLSPWPNRVGDGRWELDGTTQQLTITEPERQNAIHGLLRYADYEVLERTAGAVRLGAIVPPQPGWPSLLETWVEYRAVAGGLDVRHGVVNRSTIRTPYAVGAHPFLRLGDAPVEELVVTVHADQWIEADDRLLPVATRPVDGTIYDLRAGVRVGDVGGRLDTAYAGVHHQADGEVARLEDRATGRRLSLRQDSAWGHVQVFTPNAFPAATGPRQAIAIEPMTAPPDALRSGEGLVWLEAGAAWSGGWSLRLS
jgi:aldose 1-epimerase